MVAIINSIQFKIAGKQLNKTLLIVCNKIKIYRPTNKDNFESFSKVFYR